MDYRLPNVLSGSLTLSTDLLKLLSDYFQCSKELIDTSLDTHRLTLIQVTLLVSSRNTVSSTMIYCSRKVLDVAIRCSCRTS